MKKNNSYVVGLDGGGTKTVAMLADGDGKVLAEDSGGPTNIQLIGADQASQVLLSLIQACCRKAGVPLSDIACVTAGLAGAGRRADQERMKQNLVDQSRTAGLGIDNFIVETDARIALEGALNGASGMVLIAGTGSIALGKATDGTILRVGGWGRSIGDEGSGYFIGREGLGVVSKALDGRGQKTVLTKLVAERFGLANQEQIIAAIYQKDFDVASIAPLVLEGAMQHDRECERILNRAAFELSEHIRSLVLKMEQAARGPRQKIPLAFLGSVLLEDTVFPRIVRQKIEFSMPQVSVIRAHHPPARGAVLMALQQLRER